MLIMTCLVMLSVVSAAPPGLADSQSSDIGSLFDQDDSPASQLHEAKLNDDE